MELSCPLRTSHRVLQEENFPKAIYLINPLLTKLVWSRWLDIGLVLFLQFMDLDFVLVHKLAKKELGQYPAILTSHLANSPYVQEDFELRGDMKGAAFLLLTLPASLPSAILFYSK